MPMRPPAHRPARPRLGDGRPSASARGYDTTWRRLRLVVLRERPVCEDCGANAATEVDHVTPLARGGTHDRGNLRSLCKGCHSRKTVRRDGGFGRGAAGGRGVTIPTA